VIDIFQKRAPQRVEFDVAGLHDLRRVGIVEQSQQKMFECRVLVVAIARDLMAR